MVTDLGIVVFHYEDPAAALLRVLDDGLGVDGLNGERVHDTDVSAAGGELVIGNHGLIEGDPGGDDEHLVLVGLLQDLGLANLEGLVVIVDDGRGGPADTNVADSLGVGSQLDGSLGGDSIAENIETNYVIVIYFK